METKTTKRTDLFLIDPRNIVVAPGFNVRIDFELEELKEQIKDKGVLNPITVIPIKDENGQERYQLVDGERRYRATMMAIEEGADIQYIKALKAARDASLEELYIQQMMRNEGKRFTEYECAVMYRRFQEEFGYTQAQIAQKFHKSAAAVCQCLSILNFPEYIQGKIAAGQMSVSAAKEIVANFETEDQQVEVARQVMDTIQKGGGKTVTCKQINQQLQEVKEAKAVSVALRKVLAFLGDKTTIDLGALAENLERTGSLNAAIQNLQTI